MNNLLARNVILKSLDNDGADSCAFTVSLLLNGNPKFSANANGSKWCICHLEFNPFKVIRVMFSFASNKLRTINKSPFSVSCLAKFADHVHIIQDFHYRNIIGLNATSETFNPNNSVVSGFSSHLVTSFKLIPQLFSNFFGSILKRKRIAINFRTIICQVPRVFVRTIQSLAKSNVMSIVKDNVKISWKFVSHCSHISWRSILDRGNDFFFTKLNNHFKSFRPAPELVSVYTGYTFVYTGASLGLGRVA